jgi:hypothetical protein
MITGFPIITLGFNTMRSSSSCSVIALSPIRIEQQRRLLGTVFNFIGELFSISPNNSAQKSLTAETLIF